MRRLPPAAGALALLVVWLFRAVLFGGEVFFDRDIHLMWVPQVEGFVRAVAAGSLPLWDPSPSFGQSLIADPGAEVPYPATWLNLVLRPWTVYTVFAFGHVLLAALAMWALARRLGLSPRAATLAGALWVLSGPFWSLTSLWHHFASAAWMPLVILLADRACASGRLRDAAAAGLVWGLQVLAGSADMCALTALLGMLVLGWRHRPRSGGLAGWRGLGRTGLVVAATAALLSAGAWVPALDHLRDSTRAGQPGFVRSYWSVHPASLAETVVPEPFEGIPLGRDVREALYEGRDPFLKSLYLGLPGLALLAVALGRRRGSPSGDTGTGWQGPVAIALGVSLVLALGRHTPLFGLVGVLFPPLQILRYPAKIMVVVSFVFALLAAEGLDAWSESRPWRRRGRVLVTAAFAVLTIGAVVAALLVHSRPELVARLLVEPESGIDLSAAVAWLRPRLDVAAAWSVLATLALSLSSSRWGPRLGAVVALVAVVDLAAWHSRPSPTAPRALYTYRPELVDAIGDPATTRVFVHDYTVADKAARLLGRPFAHVLARVPEGWSSDAALALSMQQTLAGQTPGRWGLRQAYDIDYRGLQSVATASLGVLLREAERSDPTAYLRLLQLGGVTHVVALHEDPGGLRLASRFQSLLPEPTLLYDVPDPLPRCLLVTGVRVARDVAALQTLADPGFDPRREVVLPEGAPRPPAASSRAVVERYEAGPGWMRVEVETDHDSWLVITDSWAPGWRARVDGRPAIVRRANVAFQAIAVPAGRHEVLLGYAPTSAILGLALSGLTALLALAFVLRSVAARDLRQ